jgi:hypothetical protein
MDFPWKKMYEKSTPGLETLCGLFIHRNPWSYAVGIMFEKSENIFSADLHPIL